MEAAGAVEGMGLALLSIGKGGKLPEAAGAAGAAPPGKGGRFALELLVVVSSLGRGGRGAEAGAETSGAAFAEPILVAERRLELAPPATERW